MDTLEDMIAAKLGDVGMVADEVVQEVCELVAWTQYHVAALQVLVNDSQVKVVAEGVNVHQVTHLVALLSEEHGELEWSERERERQSCWPQSTESIWTTAWCLYWSMAPIGYGWGLLANSSPTLPTPLPQPCPSRFTVLVNIIKSDIGRYKEKLQMREAGMRCKAWAGGALLLLTFTTVKWWK